MVEKTWRCSLLHIDSLCEGMWIYTSSVTFVGGFPLDMAQHSFYFGMMGLLVEWADLSEVLLKRISEINLKTLL